MSEDPQQPIDYRNPTHTPPPLPPMGRNFALGFTAGVGSIGVCWFLIARFELPAQWLFIVVVGMIVFALATTPFPRWRGFGPGVLVSFGMAALTLCGLCFYAIQHV